MRPPSRLVGAPALGLLLTAPLAANTLRWGARGDAPSLGPHAVNEGVTNNVSALLYDTLAERARDQTMQPTLASAWKVVDDRNWRFSLRPGVRFHDDTPLSADDVVFSTRAATTTAAWDRISPMPAPRARESVAAAAAPPGAELGLARARQARAAAQQPGAAAVGEGRLTGFTR